MKQKDDGLLNDLSKSDELEVNKKNREEFERLMDNAANKHDSYWDKSNPVVKLILWLLLILIVLGTLYYIISWYSFK